MIEFSVKTSKKEEIVDITKKIEERIKHVKSGIATIFTQHSTAAIIINENWDPELRLDILEALDKLIPQGIWRHDKRDNNAAAHIKATILGPSETVPVKDGKLLLGRWQSLALVELDGPRERSIIIAIQLCT